MDGIKDESSDHELAVESIQRRATAPRKATQGKKIKDEASESQDEDEAFEPVEAPPKSRGGRKKTTANDTANGTSQTSKSKATMKAATTTEVCLRVPLMQCASTDYDFL